MHNLPLSKLTLLVPVPLRCKMSVPGLQEGQKVFRGYGVDTTDPSLWSDFKLLSYPSKIFKDTDIEIAITHCGVCGSDVHTLTQGWGAIKVPLVVGHEIAGYAVRVGSAVKTVKPGDRVGIGAQIGSCYSCKNCKTNNENYCPKWIDTYGDQYPDGVRTMGGYSDGIIADERLVFPIPEGVKNEHACSMLCGGLTVYSPLTRNGCGPGTTVGVIGIGGLGHYAVLFAKALGARVIAFSHSPHKRDDVLKMGADHYVITEKGFEQEWENEIDMIISTRDVAEDFPLKEYIKMLVVHGKFINVGLPDKPFPPIDGFTFLKNGCYLGTSHIGSKKEALEMLKLAAEKNIEPWIQELPMSKASDAILAVQKGNVRYRYVLTQDLPILPHP